VIIRSRTSIGLTVRHMGHMPHSIGVLVVEDFEPFRRFLCSALQKVPGLQIVGEVSDGLEATNRT
jgi:hypothetical protein